MAAQSGHLEDVIEVANQDREAVLLVEDTLSLAEVYKGCIERAGISVKHVASGADALDVLHRRCPRVVLLDLQLPDMNGLDILTRIHEQKLPTSVVVITANASMKIAIDAMRQGAQDFLVKPVQADRLIVTTRNALKSNQLQEIVQTYQEDFDRKSFQGFVGSSLVMQAIYRIIDSAASSKATVFITGESGTGKEVCAEAIHRSSSRRQEPFVAVNCGAIPRDLIESELFGHVKGAFTGAVSDRIGAAKQADGGTLFLDEIAEMDVNLQTKLLRFLQTGQVQRVGDPRPQAVDVRIICATNREPLADVQAGRFREDLYYRIHVIPIHLPPLRERDSDILEIARQFLAQYAKEEGKSFKRFDREAEDLLLGYQWPGNVRQLQNVLRSAIVLHDGDTLGAAMLPTVLHHRTGPRVPPRPASAVPPVEAEGPASMVLEPASTPARGTQQIRPLHDVEKQVIEEAIALCGGNIPKAAALLEISASTIYRKRQTWQVPA